MSLQSSKGFTRQSKMSFSRRWKRYKLKEQWTKIDRKNTREEGKRRGKDPLRIESRNSNLR
jgi:hypothetical protein